MSTSAIVGKVVEFTTQKDATNHGVVLGVVDMLHNNNVNVVTGYLIQDTLGKLHHVVYWRLTKIMKNPSEQQPPLQPTQTFSQTKFIPQHNFKEEEADDLPF